MNTEKYESVSAMMDGELPDDRNVAQILDEREYAEVWKRYHLIRDCIQGNLVKDIDYDLSRRVAEALENEPTILAPVGKKTKSYLKPAAGFAIAASVTVAVLIGVQTEQKSITQPQNVAVVQPQPVVQQPVRFVSQDDRQQVEPRAITAESPINRYLLNYNEYRTNTGVNGMLPYVRIVGHESQR